jgi:hypothetical protein
MSDRTAYFSFSVTAEAERLVDSAGTNVVAPLDAEPLLASGLDLMWSDADRTWLVRGFGIG